jgi:hypothetical protein
MDHRAEMEARGDGAAVPMEGAAEWTFDAVQDRLVEAMLTCWRGGDRERGWLRGGADGPWHMVLPDAAYDGGRDAGEARIDAAIRPAALTRRDVDEMEEAFAWVEALDAGQRRLVSAAVAQLARGQRQVSWVRVARSFGLDRGTDGLRMRYGRAIASIAARLNGGNPRGFVSNDLVAR